MNKIVVNDNLVKDIDDSVVVNYNDNKLVIKIVKDTDLELIINTNIDLELTVNDNITTNIYKLSTNLNTSNYEYKLYDNSKANIYNYNITSNIKEEVNIYLKGIQASINYIFKTISKTSENYKLNIYHQAIKTNSNIINHGVNVDAGDLIFNVSSYIPKDIIGCYANQTNRIINLTNNKCAINPNLYIDEDDVIANHSAYLGRFRDEEIFYLESRGIDYDSALSLLIKGFLLSNIESDLLKDKIDEQIKEYWR